MCVHSFGYLQSIIQTTMIHLEKTIKSFMPPALSKPILKVRINRKTILNHEYGPLLCGQDSISGAIANSIFDRTEHLPGLRPDQNMSLKAGLKARSVYKVLLELRR